MYGAIIGAVGGIAQGIMGAQQQAKANRALSKYQRQNAVNAYKDVSVSMEGADYAQEQLAIQGATAMDAYKSGGVRGVAVGAANVHQTNVDTARKIGANLDEQRKTIDMAIAGDDVRLQRMEEDREIADLAGIGNQLAVGQQNMFGGIGAVAQAGSSMQGQSQANRAAGAAGTPTTNNFFGGSEQDATFFAGGLNQPEGITGANNTGWS